MNRTLLTIVLLLAVVAGRAGSLDELRRNLEQSSLSQVQEKVYVHTDNNCYFVGDTLWYKAYVVRSDNHRPTNMSRILYVELLSPDGLLVERQNIIVSPTGHTCGQFVLRDSLYSGYYEVRAYTRWQLNFNVDHRRYSKDDTWAFYNKELAADYYRQWDGLFSRAIPVYGKPDEPGDYDARRMYQRPKTRLPRPRKEELQAVFYPEGGHLIEGVRNRVAFELHDQNGEAVTAPLTLTGATPTEQTTQHMGRGSFVVTPGAQRLKATFKWRGKDYSFNLPKAETTGVALTLTDGRVTLSVRGLLSQQQYALAVLTRGVLRHFQPLQLTSGTTTIDLPLDSLATGVSDLVVFDADGQILADRLFFVNHHEADNNRIVTSLPATTTFSPYQQVEVPVQLPDVHEPTVFSLSVRDTRTDEPSYDDGNLLTSLLLSSELRGFIARPAYYFESDDEQHRRHLDLLMMVQGWRRHPFHQLADTAFVPRYEAETSMTVEGTVYKMLGIAEVVQDEVAQWPNGVGRVGNKSPEEEAEDVADPTLDGENIATDETSTLDDNNVEFGSLNDANGELGVNHSNLRRDVLVEAELIMGDEIVAAVQKTEKGRFKFQIPPFYGVTYLNLKAYKEKDSIRKSMISRQDATVFREDTYPDFYVKRDMPYPVFTHPYTFYENHAPDYDPTLDLDTLSLSELSMENDVHQLQNVNVRGRRRGLRAVDWQKPAFVRDAYDLYNDLTDYGLSFGKYDMRQFPLQVARFLYGNMGRYTMYNVDGRLEGQTYWRNYSDIAYMGPTTSGVSSELQEMSKHFNTHAPGYIYKNLKLSRLQNIRVFSDYEPRISDSTMVENHYSADATVELVPIADDGTQVVYRDRHIYFYGFSEPAVFYQPNYAERQPAEPNDYRRTLYWNPNAVTDEQGRFTATFYNNSKETRIKISAAGVTPDGRLLYSK